MSFPDESESRGDEMYTKSLPAHIFYRGTSEKIY